MNSAIVNRSTYYFTPVIFNALEKISPNERTHEYWLTDAIELLIKDEKKIGLVKEENIVDVASPEDLKKAAELI